MTIRLFQSFLLIAFLMCNCMAQGQAPHDLIGYWHNWNDASAPYIELDAIDDRYIIVEVAFAVPTSPSDMTMTFVPDITTQSALIQKIQVLKNQGKKVMLSIGGANTSIDLSDANNQTSFVTSMTSLINTYDFDGIDIDIENGNSILVSGGTIVAPTSVAQINLIAAIKQIMSNYRTTHNHKLMLTMAPETAYVQGGMSAFGSIWGGYLPIIDGLRDSLDILQVQLYNSGSMFGIDGNVYAQGTADFILAMTEAVIQGFNTTGGAFAGLPASKVAVGLPACTSAAGGGFVDFLATKSAIDYLMGNGTQPGSYVLTNPNGYPDLRGMMTWSINWDAVSSCGGSYGYAETYESIFNVVSVDELASTSSLMVYPNPSNGKFTLQLPIENALITITDALGREVLQTRVTQKQEDITLEQAGIYFVNVLFSTERKTVKLVVNP